VRHSTANCEINLRFGSAPVTDASMSRTTSSSASFSLKIFTALIGSPTYFSSPNCTVLTSPPFLISRQGVIRGLNISQVREVLQQSRPVLMALFRMKLHAEDVRRRGRTGKIRSVAGDRQRVLVP